MERKITILYYDGKTYIYNTDEWDNIKEALERFCEDNNFDYKYVIAIEKI